MTARTQAALLLVLSLIAGLCQAQARGPSYKQIRQEGAVIGSAEIREEQQWLEARIKAAAEQELEDQERLALQDPDYRFRKFADLEQFLEVMPGRYRIESRVQYLSSVSAPEVRYSDSDMGPVPTLVQGRGVPMERTWVVAGSAECIPVELEADLRCQFEPGVVPVIRNGRSLSYLDPTGSMRAAVLWLALDRERPELRSTLATDGGAMQDFTGRMDDGVISSKPGAPCASMCFQTLEASASADAERITLVLGSRSVTVTLTLDRVSAPVRDNVLRPDSALLAPGRRR